MEERLAQLEARVDRLAEAVARIEVELSRRGAVGAAAAAAPLGRPAEDVVLPSAESLSSAVPLLGRSFIVLAGAFLVRAVTGMSLWPRPVGVAVGLAYALAWFGFAHFAAARGRKLSAELHGVTASLIAFPLLWESATRFGVLSPELAAVMAGLLGAGLLWAAALHPLVATGWSVAMGAMGALSALIATDADRSALGLAALLLALGSVAVAERKWLASTRWPLALLATFAVLRDALPLGREDAAPASGEVTRALWVCAGLAALYVGALAFRTLANRGPARAFEALQTPVAVAAALVASVRLCQGGGVAVVGGIALLFALGFFALTFGVVEPRQRRGFEFLLDASMALGLTLVGSALVAGHGAIGVVWGGLGLAAVLLGYRIHRRTLWSHAAILAWAAAYQSGLAGSIVDAFLKAADSTWQGMGVFGGLVLALAGGSAGLMLVRKDAEGESWATRFGRAAATALTLLGLGALLVQAIALVPAVREDAGILATCRTAVVAAAAVVLASGRRLFGPVELSALAYLTLAAGGLKLLIEDLPRGRPGTLFPAFALYGISLVLVPRIGRVVKALAQAAETPAAPAPEKPTSQAGP